MGLQRRPTGWYYRRMVPKGLRELVGKREWVRSLGDVPEGEAKARAGELDREIEELCTALRRTQRAFGPDHALAERSSILGQPPPSEGHSQERHRVSSAREAFTTDRQHSVGAGRARVVRAHLDRLEAFLPAGTVLDAIGKPEAQAFRASLLEEGLRPSYVNQVISTCGAMWRWAEEEAGLVDRNPWRGMRLRISRKKHEERLPFDEFDLDLIHAELLAGATSGRYWIPRLMLSMGMRPEEAASLRRQDLQKHGDLWCLEITESKTDSSERLLPIPSHVLPELYPEIEGIAEGYLFPELRPSAERGRSQSVSEWFNKGLRRIGITNRRKTLYSMRHTLATRLGDSNCLGYVMDDIMGHTPASEAQKRYRSPSELLQRHQALSRAWEMAASDSDKSTPDQQLPPNGTTTPRSSPERSEECS